MELPQDYTKLSPADRKIVRLAYVERQGGKCHYCGGALSSPPTSKFMNKRIKRSLFPPTFFQWPVHLHHCHETGMTIGAVHNICNAILWQYHGE